MQTPKARNVSLDSPLKTSPKTARQVKMPPGSESDSGPPRRVLKNTSPKVAGRKSPPSPASEKKRFIKMSELESQLTHFQEELKKVKEQLNSSELSRKRAHQEAELAKRQLAATSDRLEESQKQLIELSACEDGRISELRKLSHDRDRAWESELEALQKQHVSDSSALAFANNEISKLRLELKESHLSIDKLKTQLKDSEVSKETPGLEELKAMNFEAFKRNDENNEELEKLKVELNCARTEVGRLKTALDLADKRYQEEYVQSTFQIRSAYELLERTKSEFSVRESELEAKLKRAKEEIEALETNKAKFENIEENQKKEGEAGLEMDMKRLEAELEVLKACLMDKEVEIQSMVEENKMLKTEIEKIGNEFNRETNEAVALAESEREAEMRLLKIQSDQWRKAAEVATAMLSNENGDSNYHTIGGKLGLPFSEDVEEEFANKKNATVLKKIGVLWKKGPK